MADAALQLGSIWHAIENAIRILEMTGGADETAPDSSHAGAELVAAAMGGDGDAFARIIERHQSTIADQMRRFSRDQTVLEELVHDVFVEAYRSLRSYRADSPLLHWLRKIAVRVGYQYWKRQSRNGEQSLPLSEIKEHLQPLVNQTEDSTNASETIGGLLEFLAPPDRLVLTLIYWDGCSVAEAAELTGWSQANVKVRVHRARNRLRELIEESLK